MDGGVDTSTIEQPRAALVHHHARHMLQIVLPETTLHRPARHLLHAAAHLSPNWVQPMHRFIPESGFTGRFGVAKRFGSYHLDAEDEYGEEGVAHDDGWVKGHIDRDG